MKLVTVEKLTGQNTEVSGLNTEEAGLFANPKKVSSLHCLCKEVTRFWKSGPDCDKK